MLIALINTVISLYYYLLVVKAMFIKQDECLIENFRSDNASRLSISLCVLGIVVIGLISGIYDQIFEYTYSLALKMLKRYFALSAFASENIEGMTFNEMVRTANKMGLLRSNLETWDVFRQKRNATSHTYNEKAAFEVVSVIEDFTKEIEFLLNKLKGSLS